LPWPPLLLLALNELNSGVHHKPGQLPPAACTVDHHRASIPLPHPRNSKQRGPNWVWLTPNATTAKTLPPLLARASGSLALSPGLGFWVLGFWVTKRRSKAERDRQGGRAGGREMENEGRVKPPLYVLFYFSFFLYFSTLIINLAQYKL